MSDEESSPVPPVEEDTAIITDEKKRRKEERRKRREKRQKQKLKDSEPNYDIPGVKHVAITEITQRILNCVVGEGVTSERPWRTVKRDQLEELVESDENSEFMPYKQEILEYPREEMLIGYIADETRDTEEFYFCINIIAEDEIIEIIAKAREAQHARLENTIHKLVKPWKGLGSDKEVNDFIYKNNRPLYRVEMETSYPVMSSKVYFKSRFVKEARDGYLEIIQPPKYIAPSVTKRRIDASVQVAPLCVPREAQTDCTYPKNQWTQYEYEYNKIEKLSKEFTNKFDSFVDQNIDFISDNMAVNSNINFYTDDYARLVTNESYTKIPREISQQEYMSFTDIIKCKDKLISCIAWHPMWTGTVALSYSFQSPYSYVKYEQKEDKVNQSVFGLHAVLIWSFKDGLCPKLLLESHTEVRTLAFCPHNENLLIGGTANGQVILWDIKNKLDKVEEEEILTTDQQKYRVLMFSLMKWMKNTKDLSIVRPTAISDLIYSSECHVCSIQWLHPCYEVTKTGQMRKIEKIDEAPIVYSLQFVSSSLDGAILFWDLLAKPTFQAGDYKPQRKSRRLKSRPSALTQDVSPFRPLNRCLRPIFKVNIQIDKTYACLSFISLPVMPLKYVEVNPDSNRPFNITDRIKYKPIIELPEEKQKQHFVAGTFLGEFLVASWDGFDYSSGDIVNVETAKIINYSKYHDGPIVSIERNPKIQDLILTVGGKVFCIWKEDLKDRPVLWRRSRGKYTYGSWSTYKASILHLNKSDGNRESWFLINKTDSFYYDVSYSGTTLLSSATHPLKIKKNVIGISDDKGSLRLIFIQRDLSESNEAEIEFIKKIFSCNVERKTEFLIWQENWMSVHASWVLKMKQDAIAEAKRMEEEKEAEKLKAEELQAQLEKEEAKKLLLKSKPQPGHYIEWAQEQWIIKEQDRVANIMLSKKGLNKDMLIKQQAPLKKLEKEDEKKRQKQKDRISKSDQIFNDTIAMLFPDLVQQKVISKPDPYLCKEDIEVKEKCFSAYKQIAKESADIIESNPFEYKFNWKEVIISNQKNKRNFDIILSGINHKKRHEADIREMQELAGNYEAPPVRIESEEVIEFDIDEDVVDEAEQQSLLNT